MASLLTTVAAVVGLAALPAANARADLMSPGNQLWQQGSAGLAGQSESETKYATGTDFGTITTRGDEFGGAIASGDFNGDGIKDAAIGAPGEDAAAYNYDSGTPYASLHRGRGHVSILYGSREGGLNAASRTQDFSPALIPGSNGQEAFGSALAAGDFNGDGSDDLAIGAPGSEGVVVLYGSRPGGLSTVGRQFWSQDSAGVQGSVEAGDAFGSSLAAGDFNGDRNADLAIGAPGEDDEAGAVNVLLGRPYGLSADSNQMWDQNSPGIEGGAEGVHDNCSAAILCGGEKGDGFGWSLAAGDFDANGRDDLAIGVPYELTDEGQGGAVAVLYSKVSGLASDRNQFFEQGSDDDAIDGEGFGAERFGWSLAAGRFGNYGGDSLAIGVPGDDGDAGAVNVIYSSPHGLEPNGIADQLWTQNTGGMEGGAERGDFFGTSVAAGALRGSADLDALVIGVPGEDVSAGAVAVVYPRPTGVLRMLNAAGNQLWMQGSDAMQGAAENPDLLGAALATGDFDGNGAADLLAGAPGEDLHAGAANVIYSSRPTSTGDVTPPSITEHVTGHVGRNGWLLSDVKVTFDVKDAESPLLSTWSCEGGTVTTDGAREITCVAKSQGGVSRRTATIKRDTQPPSITATRTSTADGDVRVEFTCSDAASGIDACTPPQTVRPGETVFGTAEDRAGHATRMTVYVPSGSTSASAR
ncbi:MAG TPA: FG-GAP repeat protein [Solirubrobacter sp.]|nr:FG-GAP repeat protein [Solirubrobacter sp.]